MKYMDFGDALFSMRAGLTVTRKEIIEDVYIKDYYYVIFQSRFHRIYMENGLMCQFCPSEQDILALDWYIYTEED